MTGFSLANVLRSKTGVPVKKRTILQGSHKLALDLGLARNYEIRDVLRFFAAHHESSYKAVIFDNKTSDVTTHCRTSTLLLSAVCNANFLLLFFKDMRILTE